VDALQETLQRLEKADDVLLRLTEDKAALQLQLRDAQAAAEGVRAAAEERGRQAAEAECACLDLQRQLDAAMEQHGVAHAAVEGAADHLQQLTGSHEGLERQLAQASGELQAAQQELAQRTQLAARLEQAAMALDAELRQALHQRDSTNAQLQEAQRQLAAAQQEAAAQHHLGGELQQRLAAAVAAQEELAAERRGLAAENANLKENLQVCLGQPDKTGCCICLVCVQCCVTVLPALPANSITLPSVPDFSSAGTADRVRGCAAAGQQRGPHQPDAGGQHV
jgi:chromosome segregation ATPase